MKQVIPTVESPMRACIVLPGSKSITNRALLLAALAEGKSTISDLLISDDTLALIHALQQLGVVVHLDKISCSCVVVGVSGQFPNNETSIWCADAGTVLRFLLAACAASSGNYHFDASLQLRNRPIFSLLQTLCDQGASVLPVDAQKLPFILKGAGQLAGGKIEIDGAETSQFASALLMASPFAKEPMMLTMRDREISPYVEMTCAMMSDFGVKVQRVSSVTFSVSLPQYYKACDYTVEPDFSTASYFFAAAAITNGEVTIQRVSRARTLQGDAAFLSVLEKMGCQITEDQLGVTVKGPLQLDGIEVDMRNFSDTFMTLAAIAPFAKTPTTITNIGHTRYQESNRITAMRKNLETLQVRVEEGSDWIRIYPSVPQAGQVDSFQDHRIAMACSLIGLRVRGIEINGAECVAKTCPDFFDLWKSLIRCS